MPYVFWSFLIDNCVWFYFRSSYLLLSSILSLLTLSSDDPYYYLYYGKAPRYPSYFSLEKEGSEWGRVIRFDSLSKILSAGIRIGLASGPGKILDAIDSYVSDDLVSSFFPEIPYNAEAATYECLGHGP